MGLSDLNSGPDTEIAFGGRVHNCKTQLGIYRDTVICFIFKISLGSKVSKTTHIMSLTI